MNVTSVGAAPVPAPAPFPVQRPAAARSATDSGSHETEHSFPRQQRAEPEKVELPPLKPVTVQEFRVIVGALPANVLLPRKNTGAELDVYA